ncbi:hypothetical protein GPECTOR_2g1105 [Gonium pectorale]|uniref:Uncharacterized protein n=1 Tax=Gonium pectorale TaxID=33097 RepID=A0A150H062_GONPE|nr:hypothetical protein GPECTOR_2g1105 [Gonium pectorale]|eukprot:KXZ55556.1 hypothetical protein GPECTOR_2g1105 [Gonium pectorale]
MVLLKEVQAVLIGLENKLDAQTFDLGVAAVERSELRKELRDEKAKEVAPFHTVDFRSTELLREQVRSLQYSVRSAEAKLEAAERKNSALELEAASLSMTLREAGGSPDMAQEMRRLRDTTRNAEARALHLEGQVVTLLQQMESDRQAATQMARAQAARQAALEERLRAALGLAAAARVAGGAAAAGARSNVVSSVGGPRKSSARGGTIVDGWDQGATEEDGGRGGEAGGSGRTLDYGGSDVPFDTDHPGHVPDGSGGDGARGMGIAESRSSKYFRQSGYSPGSSIGAAGSTRGRGSSAAGRDRSPHSPPRSPVGRSLSHSPGSNIPALYPLFNAKARNSHAFSVDASTWHSSNPSIAGGGSFVGGPTYGGGASFTGGASYTGGASFPGTASFAGDAGGPPPQPPLLHLPPPSHTSQRDMGLSPRSASAGSGIGAAFSVAGGGAGGGTSSRPQSGHPYGSGPGLEVLQEGRGMRSMSASSRDAAGPGEPVRAINSSATVTSRTLLPSVSNGSAGGGTGGGGSSGAGTARSSAGLGILSLRVSTGTGSGSGSGTRRSTGQGSAVAAGGAGAGAGGGSGMQVIGSEARQADSGQLIAEPAGGAPRAADGVRPETPCVQESSTLLAVGSGPNAP